MQKQAKSPGVPQTKQCQQDGAVPQGRFTESVSICMSLCRPVDNTELIVGAESEGPMLDMLDITAYLHSAGASVREANQLAVQCHLHDGGQVQHQFCRETHHRITLPHSHSVPTDGVIGVAPWLHQKPAPELCPIST